MSRIIAFLLIIIFVTSCTSAENSECLMDLEEKEKAIQVLTNENADLKEEIEDLNDKLSRYSDYEYQSRTLESKNGNISSELSDCKDEFERYKA